LTSSRRYLDEAEPDGLALKKLYRAPVIWEEQRSVVGAPRGGE
jgi:hypothetical protein